MSSRWRNAATTDMVRRLARPDLCFSNLPDPLYLWSGIRCRRALMAQYRSDDRPRDRLLTLLEQAQAGTTYYVWYYDDATADMLIGDPSALLADYVVSRRSADDGQIFELRAQSRTLGGHD
jgi:hypothetical protein